MELVISIVSWNSAELLRKCLQSLRQHVDFAATRVVVIDNASKDGTPQMVASEFPEVMLINSGGNLGFGKAHNLIASATTEPFILFLNPDTEFVEPAHERMLQMMKAHSETGLVGCRMVNLDHSVQPLGFQWHSTPWTELVNQLVIPLVPAALTQRLLPYHDPLADGYVRKLYGGALMAPRAVLDRVGWFDERFFMYGEDVDLSRRVRKAGFNLYYQSSTRIIHLCGGCSAKAPGRFATMMQCESISKLMNKYYGAPGRAVHSMAVFTRALLVLGLVGAGKLVGRLLGQRLRGRLTNSWVKHMTMMKWSLGVERPSIPR